MASCAAVAESFAIAKPKPMGDFHCVALGPKARRLSELRELAMTLRHLLRSRVIAEDFEAAINGQGSFYLVLFWRFGQTPGSGHPTSIETWLEDVQKGKLIFPGIFGTLEKWSGRAEVLYLNEWLQPLSSM